MGKFTLTFRPIGDLPGINLPKKWLDFAQPSSKFEALGFDSGSTLVNNISLILIYFLVFGCHMALYYLPCFRNKEHENKLYRNIAILKAKIIDIIFYIGKSNPEILVYVRLLLEAHEGMALSSAGEIRELQSDSTATVISHILAWLFFLFCLLMPTVTLYFFYSTRRQYDPEKKTLMMEFFAGLKNNKWARMYTT